MAVPKKRIGEMLLEAGIIDETQLKAALGHQRQWGVRLGQALVDLKLATEADIVRALSLKFGFEVAKLDALEPYGHEQALKLLPREFATRNNVFPMWADTANVTVAMSDPTNLAVVDEIRFRTGRRVKVCIGGDQEVAQAVRHHYPAEGDVQAIALDLDGDSGVAGEAVFDPFGGGSKDALEAFFGGVPEEEKPQPAAPPAAPPQAPAPAARTGTGTGLPAQAAVARPAAAGRAAPQPPRTGTAIPAQGTAAPRPAPAAAAGRAAPQPQRTGTAPPPPRTGTAIPAQPAPRAAPAPAARTGTAPPPPRTGTAIPAQAGGAVRAEALRPVPVLPDGGALELEEKTGDHVVQGAELTPLDEEAEPALSTDLSAHPGAPPQRELTAQEMAILESLDRLASGAPAQPDIVKPTQAMAALIRLLIRRQIVTELEFLDELSKK